MTTRKTGFIGLEIMSKPMSRNLLDAAHPLVVLDIDTTAEEESNLTGGEAGT